DGALGRARAQLRDDGFVALGPVLDATTVRELTREIDHELGEQRGRSAYGVILNSAWRSLPAFGEVVARGALGRLAAELLGVGEVVLFQDHVVWKTPGTSEPVAWHQDFAYWPLESAAGLTLWIALDDADLENGCLHYLPGTQREGER